MRTTVKIYIACHKPYKVPSDDVYTPIQVGRQNSQYSLDMIGDDTGDNISSKNSTYCELTAMYWVWKNVHDVDYVGFCHYRRFFNYTFTNESVEELFSDGTDIVMLTPYYRMHSMQHHMLLAVSADDYVIMRSVIHNLCPEYEKALDDFLLSASYRPGNMLVCSKSLFDDYAFWIFGVLSECEKYIKLSPYSRGKRVFGYIAEFLLNVYVAKHNFKVKNIDMLFKGDGGDIIRKPRWQDKIKANIIGVMNKRFEQRPYMYERSYIEALKNEGIPIKLN